jgi:hypothetical protein
MDFFKSFFDFTKLPTKIFVVASLASVIFLFASENFIKTLHLNKFEAYAGYVGIAFVFSTILVTINFTIWVYEKIDYKFRVKKVKKEFKLALESLDPKEKAVLREFAIQGQNSVKMPFDDTVVSGLIDKGILKFNKQLGNSFIANGSMVSLSMSKYIDEIITPEHLGLSKTMTEDEKENIHQSRPKWISERWY